MVAMAHETLTLRGTLINHKVFSADGWGRGDLDVPNTGPGLDTMLVPITGKFLNVRPGDSVEVTGWYVDTKWGRQFRCNSCTPVVPDTSEGIVRWMASRLPDVGLTRARELVTRFGSELWTIIEAEPHRLCEVKGITEERAQAITDAYDAVRGEREHMTLLRGWGLTDAQVQRCTTAWGDLPSVVEHIRSDPYELASVVDGFGFKRADAVARAMGIALDAPARIRAGILHMLDLGAAEGHCFVWGGKLREMAAALLGVNPELVVQQIFAVCEMQRVVRRGARVYSVRLDRAEAACAKSILRLLGESA